MGVVFYIRMVENRIDHQVPRKIYEVILPEHVTWISHCHPDLTPL
jgi:hypothetical protein